MKKLLIITIVAISGLLTFESCKNDIEDSNLSIQKSKFDNKMLVDETITSDYVLRDGVLHFRDNNSFKKITSNLSAFEIKVKKNFPDFKSIEFLTSEATKSFHDGKNEKLKKENEYIFELNGIIRRRNNGPMTFLANEDGIFYVGKILYYYKNDEALIILSGDKKEIKEIDNGNIRKDVVLATPYKYSNKRNESSRITGCSDLFGYEERYYSNGLNYVSVYCWGWFGQLFAGYNNAGEKLYHSYPYVQVFCSNNKGSNLVGQTLRVNYFVNTVYNGNQVGYSSEPDDTIYKNSGYDIQDTRLVGYLLLTESQVNSQQHRINIEPRNGKYDIGYLNTNWSCP